MANAWVAAAGVGGFAAVALAAAGAHLTDGNAEAARLIDLGSRFLLLHSVALLSVGLLSRRGASRLLNAAGVLMAPGAVLFCGGLTLLALTGSPIGLWSTPIGGTTLLGGWLALAAYGLFTRSG